jgi:hypothetical protein
MSSGSCRENPPPGPLGLFGDFGLFFGHCSHIFSFLGPPVGLIFFIGVRNNMFAGGQKGLSLKFSEFLIFFFFYFHVLALLGAGLLIFFLFFSIFSVVRSPMESILGKLFENRVYMYCTKGIVHQNLTFGFFRLSKLRFCLTLKHISYKMMWIFCIFFLDFLGRACSNGTHTCQLSWT